MPTVDPLWINEDPGVPDEPSYNAQELRRSFRMWAYPGGNSRSFGARTGIYPAALVAVTLSGTTVTVNSTTAAVNIDLRGPYLVQFAGTTYELDPADVSNPRKDIVVGRVWDDDEDASGLREADTQYIVGTPGATPLEPPVPAGAFRMATIDVPASGGGSASLTLNAPYTVASGGVLPVRDASELPTDTMYDGMMVYRQDVNELHVRDGSFWWKVGEVAKTPTDYNPSVGGHGGASFSLLAGWSIEIYPKIRVVNMEIVVSGAGSGSTEVTLTTPTSINRTTRQIFPCMIDGAPAGAVFRGAQALTFTTGSGSVIDRVYWDDGGELDRLATLRGADLTSGLRIMVQGMYREA